MKVIVLGSCRIYRPLTTVERDGGLTICNKGVYAYAHSTKDVLQQLRHVLGAYDLDRELSPYIIDPRFYTPGEQPGTLDGIDAAIVEISSRKELVADGHYFHLTRFKGAVAKSHPALVDWTGQLFAGRLADDRSSYAYPGIDEVGRRLVTQTRQIAQDEQTVHADMAAIKSMLGLPVAFVTHFEMTDRSGNAIRARLQLREWVGAAASDLGAPFFDPSELIRAYGRSKAVRDHGHYHRPFIEELGKHLHSEYLRPLAHH